MNTKIATYVLIPGAWHGGWAWRPVAQRLRGAGHRAITLTLPGLADGDDPSGLRLNHAVNHIVNEVVRRDLTNVIMVTHSWGAYPATGAAHRLADRVSKVVHYSALVPAPGKSLVEDIPPEYGSFMREMIKASPDHTMPMSLEMVQQMLIQDVAEQTQVLLHELLVPQPGNYFLDPLDVPSVTPPGISTAYILSDDDRMLLKPGVEYAQRLNVEPIMVPGSHESLLTHPDEVAKAILSA